MQSQSDNKRLVMNKIELIKSLIDDLTNLPHRDEQKLDALRKRANMILRKVFGDSSEYLQNFNDIGFFPIYGNLYDDTWIDGKSKMSNLFNTIQEELELFGNQNTVNAQKSDIILSNKIFIVHGHDNEMKLAMARTLEKLELDPIILHEQPNEGRTIIEKFDDYSDVSFAVVLLSPDDVGHKNGQSYSEAKFRARQNVIFELGFFIGKLERKYVFVLFKKDDNFEIPSDYSGVIFTPYDEAGKWKFELVKELQNCGYDVDANKLL